MELANQTNHILPTQPEVGHGLLVKKTVSEISHRPVGPDPYTSPSPGISFLAPLDPMCGCRHPTNHAHLLHRCKTSLRSQRFSSTRAVRYS